jgi:hypothetical protein
MRRARTFFYNIFFRKVNGPTATRIIATDLSFQHKTDPNLSYENFVWYATDYYLEENTDYEMILTNTAGTIIYDYHYFDMSGNYIPTNCETIVNNQLDGDYNIAFTLNNGNTCYSNIKYVIDYGDGTTTNFISNNNVVNFSHQYPTGVNSLYNVSIKKYDYPNPYSKGSLLSKTYITVRSKRD